MKSYIKLFCLYNIYLSKWTEKIFHKKEFIRQSCNYLCIFLIQLYLSNLLPLWNKLSLHKNSSLHQEKTNNMESSIFLSNKICSFILFPHFSFFEWKHRERTIKYHLFTLERHGIFMFFKAFWCLKRHF